MSVTGSGSYFAFDGLIAQSGNLADGTLVINGGDYSFAALDTAVNTGAGPSSVTGSILLSGGADVRIDDLFGDAAGGAGFPLRATVGRAYDAGHAAYGLLSVSGGADLTLAPEAIYQPGAGVFGGYDTLNAGIGAGGTGRVEVSGAGSTLRTEGTNPLLRFGGAGGEGTLAISNGATAGLFALQAGFGVSPGAPATGRVEVSGPGSRLVFGGAYGSYVNPAYSGMSATVTIGLAFQAATEEVTGRGSLDVTDGGEVVVENLTGATDFPFLRFGRDALSYGTGLVDGAGSRLAVVQHGSVAPAGPGGATLDVGESGEGRLTVRNGGLVEVLGDRAQLSVARPIPNQPLTPATSLLTVETGGQVHVDGASASGGRLVIANGAEARAEARISGAESLIHVSGGSGADGPSLGIGAAGQGLVAIEDGGRIVVEAADHPDGRVEIGTDGGQGTLLINDATLSLTGSAAGSAAPRILIASGSGSTGDVTVSGGGLLENTAPEGMIVIAATQGATGSLTITGAGSRAAPGERILIGASVDAGGQTDPEAGGDARLVLSDGGRLDGGIAIVGGSGTLELDNAEFDAGLDLYGTLELSPGTLTTEVIGGTATLRQGSVIALDVTAFSRAATDRIVFAGTESVSAAGVTLSLTVDPDLDFFAGDSFVFASAAVPFVDSVTDFTDPTSGRMMRVIAEGTVLRVEALQGTPVTLRDDGSIQSVVLPSADPFLAGSGQGLLTGGGPGGTAGPLGAPPGLGLGPLGMPELAAFDQILF
ncbi:MAG: hypothetical protein AAF501_15445 [Pseudomonadota bacterium]